MVEPHHSITVGGETLAYTAAAGRIVLREDDGTKKASFLFTPLTLNGVTDPASRPIVFAFNGGPGSSSVWLHLWILGPKLVEFDEKGNTTSTPGHLIDNGLFGSKRGVASRRGTKYD